MSERVAVVTGGNKGIGLQIVRGLVARWGGLVYLTSRDPRRGRLAVEGLGAPDGRVRFQQLDVRDEHSVRALAELLRARHQGLDLLVHNAALAHLADTTLQQDTDTIDTNYKSAVLLEQHVFPLLREGGRVVNISSDCGHLSNVRDEYWLRVLARADLNSDDVDAFVQWYLQRRRAGEWTGDELAETSAAAYRVSKVALSARTRLQAEAFRSRGVSVNSVHPGLVRTDMTRNVGFLSPEQAAETPLWLLLDAPDTLTGAYVWFDRQPLDWADHTAHYYFKAATLHVHYTS